MLPSQSLRLHENTIHQTTEAAERGSGKGRFSLSPMISHRTYLVSILGVRGGLTATITHEIILHDVFGVALLLAHWTIHHCQDKNVWKYCIAPLSKLCLPLTNVELDTLAFLTAPITFCILRVQDPFPAPS